MRFGQFLATVGMLGEDDTGRSLWDIEDEELAVALERFARGLSPRQGALNLGCYGPATLEPTTSVRRSPGVCQVSWTAGVPARPWVGRAGSCFRHRRPSSRSGRIAGRG